MKSHLPMIRTSLLFVSVVLCALSVSAQTDAVRVRVTQAVDTRNLVTLRGNVHPLACPEFDQGVAPDDLPMQRMLLVLQRGPEQETALRQLLDDQQVKSSPRFHQWLTPEQFGQQYGPADSDLQAVTEWLSTQGFQVNRVAAGRTVIEFSGTAGLVRQVLGTEIHRFRVNGKDHWANTSDPQIPAALAPVVAGFASLNNFPRQSIQTVNAYSRSQATGEVHALFTGTSNGASYYALGPTDFATIYNVLPLWTAGIDGTGQTIAIVGETNISLTDVRGFRNLFGLPGKDPQIILNGPDPGINGDETEADIDVEWSGAVARNATIDLVVSQTTGSTLGIDLSALYIIDNNLAPIMSESYGECEQLLGAAGNTFYYATREQGAAQGITIINSSGDTGSARCDQGGSAVAAQYGLTVSGMASTPFNVAVGGTDFGDLSNFSQYWNSTNSSGSLSSARSYIPETTWNSSCAASGNCASAGSDTPTGIDKLAAGGGPSTCGVWTGAGPSATCAKGYSKPVWQTGTGVPNDGVRDIPDISPQSADNG
jgi:subtilase family serine protease